MMKTVKDVMTGGVELIFPNSSLHEAAEKMKKFDIGMLPVCDTNRLVGIITDRDIAIRAVSKNCIPDHTLVKDVMTQDVIYCYLDEPIETAAHLMQSNQIRRILVLDRNKKLCGIVSVGDLALETRNEHLAAETLEKIASSVPGESVEHERIFDLGQGLWITLSTLLGVSTLAGGYYLLNRMRLTRGEGMIHKKREKAA